MNLAKTGEFVFGFRDVLETMAEKKFISASDVPTLAKLRLLKNGYRGGLNLNGCEIAEILPEILNVIPHDLLFQRPERVSAKSIIRNVQLSATASGAYYRLRKMEKVFICVEQLGLKVDRRTKLGRVQVWIQDPSYAWMALAEERNVLDETQACLRETA